MNMGKRSRNAATDGGQRGMHRIVRDTLRPARRAAKAMGNPRTYLLARSDSEFPDRNPVSLLPTSPTLMHLGFFTSGNAGDRVLPVVLRDLFTDALRVRWKARNVHRVVDNRLLTRLNRSDGIVVGGGGLFLPDNPPTALSGWHWSCDVEMLRKVQAPLAGFALGYNRFRGQQDFLPVFRKHLTVFAEKAVYIGLRNNGSIESLKSYIPADLHEKLRFQPCMTTLTRFIYPWLREEIVRGKDFGDTDFIAINLPFDRQEMRYGIDQDQRLRAVADVVGEFSDNGVQFEYYAHCQEDERFLPYLDKRRVPVRVRRLYQMNARQILQAYTRPAVVIGGRSHSQMIPIGCGRPSISLVSHDKLWYFLQDTNTLSMGVEMASDELTERLRTIVTSVLDDLDFYQDMVLGVSTKLWEVTQKNLADFGRAVDTR